jgi:hypothetical protein
MNVAGPSGTAPQSGDSDALSRKHEGRQGPNLKIGWLVSLTACFRQLICKPQVSFSLRYEVAARLSQTTGVISESPRLEIVCPSVPHIERELGWPRMDPQSTAFLAQPYRL